MARKVLGRGLEALIPGATRDPAAGGTQRLAELDLDRIRPNPQQPRDRFDEDAILSIAESLKRHGVLQPIVVREVSDGYEIIAGERRWRAAQRAGLERMPAVIRDASAQESLELALVENLQREDLNAVEEAHAYQMLVDEMGMTQDEVARRVGRDRSTVSNYLRLLKLPVGVQELLIEGRLSMGHARALLGLEDGAAVARLAAEAVAKGLSVRQVEARVRAGERSATGAAPTRRDPDVEAAEKKLTRALGTPVRIHGKERGRLDIRFTSLDELNRIYDLLLELGRS
jgi:ParB family chromosome partitioning protein